MVEHCLRGHEKTYRSPGGKLCCIVCMRAATQRHRSKDRATRLADASAAREYRVRPLEHERAWACGYFEGEGTATIHLSRTVGTKRYYRPIITITSVDMETINFLHSKWGGTIITRQPKGQNARLAYIWTLNSYESVLAFIQDIIPYVVRSAVKQKLELLHDYIKGQLPTKGQNCQIEMPAILRERMRELNRRGRSHQTTAYESGKMPPLLADMRAHQ